MKKLSVIFALGLFACGKSSHAPEVTIGNQIWMIKNLDVSTFRNGDIIPEAKTIEEFTSAGEQSKPAWCYYENDPANGKKYGKLYNWYAVNDPRGLAPKGWHIPSEEEWRNLVSYLSVGGEKGTEANDKMKSVSDWTGQLVESGANYNGNNSSGFDGLPGGQMEYSQTHGPDFDDLHWLGCWWSSTNTGKYREMDAAFSIMLGYNGYQIYFQDAEYQISGLSVRCIKDETSENKPSNTKSQKKADFEGSWVADANTQVRYDGNRITDISVTKNGANYLFVFNKNDLGLKTMGTIDQSNNISLYGGKWLLALDATDNDNLFLQGEIFHRVK